jgi:Ca2+-binding RTX toxin-like protein
MGEAMAIFSAPKLVYRSRIEGDPSTTSAHVVLDINRDGHLDIVTAHTHFPLQDVEVKLEILLGKGDGTFKNGDAIAFSGTLPGAVSPQGGVVADFNGDGLPDVFFPDFGLDEAPNPGHRNILLLSSGKKLVEAPSNYLPGKNTAHGASAGDIDGDGDIDIFVATAGAGEPNVRSHFLINDGEGRFTRSFDILPLEPFVPWSNGYMADLDNDGDVDLWMGVNSFENIVYENDGDGNLTERDRPLAIHDTYSKSAIFMDINNDGLLDVVQSETDNQHRSIGVYVNQGGLQFTNEAETRINGFAFEGEEDWQGINHVRTGEFNGDGATDLVVESNGGDYHVLINNGDGYFFTPKDALYDFMGLSLVVRDFNSDGRDDLLAFSWDNNDAYLATWKNKPIVPLTGTDKNNTLFGDAKGNSMDGKGGSDAVRSGAGRDKVAGGSGKDTIDGGSGNDTIDSGEGKDRLTGGQGKDRFVFSTELTSADVITDFKPGTDKIALDGDIFRRLGDALDAGEFLSAPGAAAGQDGNDRIVYDTASGKLHFDVDGNKAGGKAAVHFATLTGAPALGHDDFIIV